MSLNDSPLTSGEQGQTPQSLDGGSAGRKTSAKSPKTAMREALEQAQRAKQERPKDEGDSVEGSEEAPDQADEGAGSSAGSVDGEADSGGSDDADAPRKPDELTLAGVAEQLGLTETELYDTLRINTGDGEPVTLGKAKDQIRQLQTREQGIAEREAQAEKLSAKYVSDVQALGVLTAMQSIPQPVLRQANQHLNQQMQQAELDFVTLHPEFQDPDKMQDFVASTDQLLREYNLSAAHFTVRTPGMYQLLRDVQRWKRNSDAYTRPKAKEPPKKLKASRPGGTREAGEPINLTGGARSRFAQLGQHLRK